MTEKKDDKTKELSQVPDEELKSLNDEPEADGQASQEKEIQPEIAVFLSDLDISPAAFFKALKSAKIKRFTKDDEDRAQVAVSEDISGERLWALMSQANLPEAVDRWIWPVAQARLNFVIGNKFNSLECTPLEVLQALRKALAPRLKSKEKVESKGAENWLRIGVCWLLEKRSIDLWTVAEVISSTFFEDAKTAKAPVKRAIGKGTSKEFRLSLAAVRLGDDTVSRAKSDLSREQMIRDNLHVRLADAENKLKSLEAEISSLNTQLIEKSNELKNLQTQFENERTLWGYDLSEIEGRQHVLLGERLVPLLSDAADALEVEPAYPSVALKRVKAALKEIKEADS